MKPTTTKKKTTKKAKALTFWGVLVPCPFGKDGFDLTAETPSGAQIRTRDDARNAAKKYGKEVPGACKAVKVAVVG